MLDPCPVCRYCLTSQGMKGKHRQEGGFLVPASYLMKQTRGRNTLRRSFFVLCLSEVVTAPQRGQVDMDMKAIVWWAVGMLDFVLLK